MEILFITNTRLGDTILSSSVLQYFIQHYPMARFTIAAGPVSAPILANTPRLRRLIIFKKEKYHLHWLKLWAKCLLHRWDIVIDLRGSATSLLLWTKKRFYQYAKETKHCHRIERYARFLKLNDSALLTPKIHIGKEHQQRAAMLLAGSKTIIAIAPIANWRAKTWRLEYFIELISRLTCADGLFANAAIAVITSPEERQQALPLLEQIKAQQLIDLAGTEDLLTIAACIAQSTLFVGNDSGIMHLAAAVGTATLGLFGPSDKKKYAPVGAHCDIICTKESPGELMPEGFNHLTSDSLLDSISVNQVILKIQQMGVASHPCLAQVDALQQAETL